MIHYHGGPITPDPCAIKAWKSRHAFISYAHPGQLNLASTICQSFALDCGEYTRWKSNKPTDWPGYKAFVSKWIRHPGFDFAIVPDFIEGGEADNDALADDWEFPRHKSAVVWHTDESIDRLVRLANGWTRVAIGSSGEYDVSNKKEFMKRMLEVLPHIINQDGQPICDLHGLRMLNPEIFSLLPLKSADSQNVAINIGLDKNWKGSYQPASKPTRAIILSERIEQFNSACRFDPELIGLDETHVMDMFL